MILLVCGGRYFGLTKDELWFIYEGIYDTLLASQGTDQKYLDPKQHLIRAGGAPGVDTVAEKFADIHFVPKDIMPVTQEEYDTYKKGAPVMRNRRMAAKEPIPDLVLAFNGGPGTQDMINRAKKVKIPVKRLIMGDDITKFME